MKKLLAIIVIFALLLSIAGCGTGSSRKSRKKKDSSPEDTVHLITSITIHNYQTDKIETASYEYDDTNKLVQVIIPDYRGNPEYYSYIYDDQDGYVSIKRDGNLDYRFPYIDYDDNVKYEYDNKGNVIKESICDSQEIYYEYNAQNKLIKKLTSSCTESYEYDKQGNLYKYSYRNNDGIMVYHCIYTYDSRNIPIEMTFYYDEEPTYTFTYEYTDNTVLISQYYHPGGSTPLVTIECHYINVDASAVSIGVSWKLEDILFDEYFLIYDHFPVITPSYLKISSKAFLIGENSVTPWS